MLQRVHFLKGQQVDFADDNNRLNSAFVEHNEIVVKQFEIELIGRLHDQSEIDVRGDQLKMDPFPGLFGYKRRDLKTIIFAVCHRKTGNHLQCQLIAKKQFGKSPAFVAGGS